MISDLMFVGNLGRDAEGREVGDSFVVNMNVAVRSEQRLTEEQREAKGESDEYARATAWFKVAFWGNYARALYESGALVKGAKVAIRGALVLDGMTGGPRVWEGDNGAGASFEVRVNPYGGFQLMSAGSASDENSEDEAPTPKKKAKKAKKNKVAKKKPVAVDDEDEEEEGWDF